MDSLGQIIEEGEQRDAIHVAIAPVVAAQKLAPGQDIGFVDDSNERVGVVEDPVGIVDPFLKSLVFPEQRCWMMLYPNTITGLRHHWSHPVFDRVSKSESEAWLKEFAERAGLGYAEMIQIVEGYVRHGEPWVESGSEQARNAFDQDQEEFWKHMEIATGHKKPEDGWYSPFSCSC